jgi:type IV secretion system protein VirB3
MSDILFKGCTKPVTYIGLPIAPLFTLAAGFMMFATYVNMILGFVLVLPIYGILRHLANRDDQIFSLLGLRLLMRDAYRFKNFSFWQASVYAPVQYTNYKLLHGSDYERFMEGFMTKFSRLSRKKG